MSTEFYMHLARRYAREAVNGVVYLEPQAYDTLMGQVPMTELFLREDLMRDGQMHFQIGMCSDYVFKPKG